MKRNLRCPYHSWTMRSDGKLVAAPNIGTLTDEDGRTHRPIPVRTGAGRAHEWLGYAWVCLSDTPPPFEDVVAETTRTLADADAIDRYGIGGLDVGAASSTTWRPTGS